MVSLRPMGIFFSDFSLPLSVMTTGLELKGESWMKFFQRHECRVDRTEIFYKFFLVWWKTNGRNSN